MRFLFPGRSPARQEQKRSTPRCYQSGEDVAGSVCRFSSLRLFLRNRLFKPFVFRERFGMFVAFLTSAIIAILQRAPLFERFSSALFYPILVERLVFLVDFQDMPGDKRIFL